MNYKIEGALKKSRVTIIISVILWFLMAIVFIMPLTCAQYTTTLLGHFDSGKFGDVFGKIAGKPILGLKTLIKYHLFLDYLKNIFGFSILYITVVTIGIIIMMPKHRYSDIEHC